MPERRTKGGYESDDTPASALQVPDVLFRPGLGAMAPEPQDAVPPVPKELAALDTLGDIIDLIRRRWAESTGAGRAFLIEALETQAQVAVQHLRTAISEHAKGSNND